MKVWCIEGVHHAKNKRDKYAETICQGVEQACGLPARRAEGPPDPPQRSSRVHSGLLLRHDYHARDFTHAGGTASQGEAYK